MARHVRTLGRFKPGLLVRDAPSCNLYSNLSVSSAVIRISKVSYKIQGLLTSLTLAVLCCSRSVPFSPQSPFQLISVDGKLAGI